MQLPEPIETNGYFWLEDKRHNKLAGVLSISEKGNASLGIFGAFHSPDNRPIGQLTGQRLHVLGVTDKSGAVTLVDCIVIEQNDVVNLDLLSKSSLDVGCVFWGAHFDTAEICLSNMAFSVEGLDEWFVFNHRPFSHDWDPTGPMSLSYNQPEPITFQIPDDLIIGFHMGAGMKSSLFQQTITTKMNIGIESSRPRSFSDFMQVLRKVKNFLCLAFDRTVFFTLITLSPAGTKRSLRSPQLGRYGVASTPMTCLKKKSALETSSSHSKKWPTTTTRWQSEWRAVRPPILTGTWIAALMGLT